MGHWRPYLQPNRDVSGSDFVAEIRWGDGAYSEGNLVLQGSYSPNAWNQVNVFGSHTYTFADHYSIQTVVTGPEVCEVSWGNAVVVSQTLTATDKSFEAVKDELFTGVVAEFTDSLAEDEEVGGGPGMPPGEPPFGSSNYRAKIDWGDGTTSDGVIEDRENRFVVIGSHTYRSDASFPVGVRINRVAGATIDVESSATVWSVRPLITTKDVPIGDQVVATFDYFATCNPTCSPSLSSFGGSINWGDASSSVGILQLEQGNVQAGWNRVRVIGNHTYSALGTFDITIGISGPSFSQTSRTKARVIGQYLTAVGRDIEAAQEVLFSGVLAQFTDALMDGNAGDYRATVTWGDGGSSTGTIEADGEGGFRVRGTHTYSSEGTFPLQVRINRVGGATVVTNTALLSDWATVFSVPPLIATKGVSIGAQKLATFQYFASCTPECVDLSQYSASIVWGDNTSSSATLVADGAYVENAWNRAIVRGEHTMRR